MLLRSDLGHVPTQLAFAADNNNWGRPMSIVENWKTVVFERYAQFNGRANRAEYWWYALVNICVGLVLYILMAATSSGFFLVIYVLWALATFIPSLAVAIRRLHDTGRSGWWWLIAAVPIIGAIVLIVFLASEGTSEANQYGVAPGYATA